MKVSLNIAPREEGPSDAFTCTGRQCESCVIHKKWCGGFETCCGSGNADAQETCGGACSTCLGMYVEETGESHPGTYDVCGKPAAVLRPLINDKLPLPAYQRKTITDLPAYIPVLTRMPRGPMAKEFPWVTRLCGTLAQDMHRYRNKPEGYSKFVDRPMVLCSEQDFLQDRHESWYPSWSRTARNEGFLRYTTAIEFSAYAGHGNLSHYRSIFRSLRSANLGHSDFWVCYCETRLDVDAHFTKWLRANPNVFIPYGFTKRGLFKFRKMAEATGGLERVRILLAHVDLDRDVKTLPAEIRRVCSYLDTVTWPSAFHGGHTQAEKDMSRVEAYFHREQMRRKKVEQILRG